MPVMVQCPNPSCRKAFQVDESLIGFSGRCADCGQKITVQPSGDSSLQEPVKLCAAKVTGGAKSEAQATPSASFDDGQPLNVNADEPDHVGRFQVRAELGCGAFGTVYRAYDPQLDREVALKVPRQGVLDSPKRIERFLREARAAAQLRHPNIVPIYDAGQDGERHFIAAAFVAGQPLSAAIDDSGLDCQRAAKIVRQLAEAVGYAHERGIIHRDIKPANVMLDDKDRPHLMDFGLATRTLESEKLTQDGSVMGTPAYMAPEQAQGQQGEAQPASDQYSLGVLLYELLTGRVPFAGPVQVVMYSAVNSKPPAPRGIRADIPVALERICLKAMAKKPQLRYVSCQALADDLGRWLEGGTAQARSVGSAELLPVLKQRPRLALTAAAIVIVLIGALALWSGGVLQPANKSDHVVRAPVQPSETGGTSSPTPMNLQLPEKKTRVNVPIVLPVRVLEGHRGRVAHLAFSPDGKNLLSGSDSDRVNNAVKPAVVTRGPDDTIRYWDLQSGKHLRVHDFPWGVRGVGFAGAGELAVASSHPDQGPNKKPTVLVCNLATGQRVASFELLYSGMTRGIALTPDGKSIVICRSQNGIEWWDVASMTQTARIELDNSKNSKGSITSQVAFTQNRDLVLGGSAAGAVHLWDTRSGKLVRIFLGHSMRVRAVAFSGDEKRVAAAADDGTIRVWNVDGDQAILRLEGHEKSVYSIAFSNDGRWLLSGGEDQTTRLWDANTGAEVYRLDGHVDIVTSVAFSPNNRLAAAGSEDGSIRLWQIAEK
ncbi:MAG TPA: protein kinase [Gemmataceae bacterium]|nr:protein kinase [Gemmataceae bacterium]